MLPNDTQLYDLIQRLEVDDPVIKDLLRAFVVRIQILNAEVFPPSIASVTTEEPDSNAVPDVTSFTYELIPTGIRFSWTRPSPEVVLFELRKGATWDTGSTILTTSTLSAVLEGQTIGTHTYWIKALGLDGTYSENPLQLDVVIPSFGTISILSNVIDNFVELRWSVPSSAFRIDYYIITKNSVEIGRQTGTFIPIFESVGGTYTYGIQAVDIFENTSNVFSVEMIVNQPPDYILEELETSTFSGTRTNVALDTETPSLLANIDLTETWADYAANGYSTLQDEIDVGLVYWMQPTLGTGEYEEVVDFGSIFSNIVVSVGWDQFELVPSMTINTYLSTSDDNITYTSEVSGMSVFAATMRYTKLRIEFIALN